VSVTLTIMVGQVLVSPALFVAVHTTLWLPMPNVDPEGGVHPMLAMPDPSTAENGHVATTMGWLPFVGVA